MKGQPNLIAGGNWPAAPTPLSIRVQPSREASARQGRTRQFRSDYRSVSGFADACAGGVVWLGYPIRRDHHEAAIANVAMALLAHAKRIPSVLKMPFNADLS